MSRLFPSMLVPLAALVLAIAAHGQSEPPAEAASSADAAAPATSAASMPSHGAAAHVEAVRHAHLRRLQERLDTPEEELHRTCRFESDIATLPPQGVVALTFDDGPEPGHTEEILAILERHQVPATFFLIAEKAHAHPELVARMKALPGAVLGNHSWSHPNFHDIPVDEQREQIVHADAQLRPELAAAPVFRYPYGNSSCEGNDQVHALGYRIVGWHVDSCDWAFDGPEGLTARELQICGRIASGDSNKLIARAFELSPHTVKRHVANILDKLALASRGQVAAWYMGQARG